MNEYLKNYPEQRQDIEALSYSLGADEADFICSEAMKKNKKIELITDNSMPDYLDYKFI